jgi:hypothetical protein
MPRAEHRLRTSLYMRIVADSPTVLRRAIDTTEARVLYVCKGGWGAQDESVLRWRVPHDGAWSPFKEFSVKAGRRADRVLLAQGRRAGGVPARSQDAGRGVRDAVLRAREGLRGQLGVLQRSVPGRRGGVMGLTRVSRRENTVGHAMVAGLDLSLSSTGLVMLKVGAFGLQVVSEQQIKVESWTSTLRTAREIAAQIQRALPQSLDLVVVEGYAHGGPRLVRRAVAAEEVRDRQGERGQGARAVGGFQAVGFRA